MMLSAFLVAFIALMRWTAMTLASQGRLLFPVIAVISCFLAVGVMQIVPRVVRPIGWNASCVGLCVALGGLAFATPFAYIAPAYALPQRLQSEAQLPANLNKVELRFQDKIRWLGYTAQQSRLRPGEVLDLTLYWQGLKPIDKNYTVGIRLLGHADKDKELIELIKLDTYPGGGMWQTTLWKPDQIIADHYRLRIPSDLTVTLPSVVKLDVDVGTYAPGSFVSLTPTLDAQGQPSSRQYYEVSSIGQTSSETDPTQATSRLNKANLLSVTTRQEGREIVLTTTWLCTQDVGEDYTMFVQLFDASNTQLKPQADGPIAGLPVKWWRKGDVIVDERRLVLSDDIQPGAYAIKFGLYKPSTFERMRAFDADGQPLADDALVTEFALTPNP
jgi:hypothetical protein